MNNLAMLQALVFEPRKAFAELDARPRFAWPFWMLVLSSAALMAWYVSFVDLEWLSFQEQSQNPFSANMTDEEIARMARAAAERPGVQIVLRTLVGAFGAAFFVLLGSLYYLLAGKVSGTSRSFRHWMALASWTSMPSVLAVVPAAIVLLTSGSTQLRQDALQPLSLNGLFLGLEPGQTGFAPATYANVFTFIALYLATVGVRVWSGRGWLYSFLFTALPLLLIVGIWALVALR